MKSKKIISLIYISAILFLTACSQKKPPYFGAFLMKNGGFVELTELEIFDITTIADQVNLEITVDSQPVIVLWRPDTDLNSLEFYAINDDINRSEIIEYHATPKEDGIIEIRPSTSLSPGKYCLIQGDPLAVFLPGWCFKVDTMGFKQQSASPTEKDVPLQPNSPTQSVVLPPDKNYALEFDGLDDFVSIQNRGKYNFGNEFTVEAWIKPISLAGRGVYKALIQGSFSEPPFTGGGWGLALDRLDYTTFGLSVCVPDCMVAESESGELQTNVWQHVAGVYNGREITTYRNGARISTQSQSGNVSQASYILLGTWETSFSGLMDEVRIWDIARSQSDIQNDKDKFLSGDENGLVSYWHFDEGEGQVNYDSTINGYDGKLGSTASDDRNDPVWVESDVPVK
jgi:hypothetical protein